MFYVTDMRRHSFVPGEADQERSNYGIYKTSMSDEEDGASQWKKSKILLLGHNFLLAPTA